MSALKESSSKDAAPAMPESETAGANEVRLVGRLSAPAEERELPSGDAVITFRVILDRPPDPRSTRRSVDVIECAVWSGRARRTVSAWSGGETVEIAGALRRRFYRTGAGTVSRVEVVVSSARTVRRAAT